MEDLQRDGSADDGTSTAAAIASGVAALLFSRYPQASAA
jgi:subtilisin family serine protease